MSTMEIKEGTSNEIVQFKSDNEINFQLDLVYGNARCVEKQQVTEVI